MRAQVAIAAALLALAGCRTNDCKKGTVLVSFSLPSALPDDSSLAINLSLDGATPIPNTLQLRKGLREGSVEIDFPHNYIAGDSLEVELIITDGDGELVASRRVPLQLASVCSTLYIALDGDADGGSDGSFGDGSDALAITPAIAEVGTTGVQAFTANRPVTWAVSEPNGGTIDHSGVYIAPSKVGTYHVVGTSSDGQTASATVNVNTWALSVLAGQLGGAGNADDAPSRARLGSPTALVFDSLTQREYVVDSLYGSLRAYDAQHTSTLATSPLLKSPSIVIASDGNGHFYFRSQDCNFQEVTVATGAITAIANSPSCTALPAIGGMTWVTSQNALAVTSNNTVQLVNVTTGAVTFVAGGSNGSAEMDASGAMAIFSGAEGILSAGSSTLYVADNGGNTIRQVSLSDGSVITIAGTYGTAGSIDAVGAAARFDGPTSIAYDSFASALYVAESQGVIRQIVLPENSVTTLAGAWQQLGYADGVGDAARFGGSLAIDLGVLVADARNNCVRQLDPMTRTVTTVFGVPLVSVALDGRGNQASFVYPGRLTSDGVTVYVSDELDQTVRAISLATQEVTLVAGTSGLSGSKDGVGAAATFFGPAGLALDGNGYLFVADNDNELIRQIDLATGQVTTLAGMVGRAGGRDGTGVGATFSNPVALAFGGGFLYVADAAGPTIRRVDVATAEVTTVAGKYGASGSADQVGPVASFIEPNGVALDGKGNLFVSDGEAATVRQIVLATGQVSTIAGLAKTLGWVDGVGSAARFNQLSGVAYVANGTLVVGDPGNQALRLVDVTSHAVTTWAGVPGEAGVATGPLPARLNAPRAPAALPDGSVIFADEGAFMWIAPR